MCVIRHINVRCIVRCDHDMLDVDMTYNTPDILFFLSSSNSSLHRENTAVMLNHFNPQCKKHINILLLEIRNHTVHNEDTISLEMFLPSDSDMSHFVHESRRQEEEKKDDGMKQSPQIVLKFTSEIIDYVSSL